MDLKRYLSFLTHFIINTIMVVVTLLSFAVSSDENRYQLIRVAELEHQLISKPNWQQIIANPNNKQQYFAIRESGQVYLIDDDNIDPQAILDMNAGQKINPSFFKLTAITLHPNFSLRNQDGYGTFYTAHIENIDTKSKTKRIQERDGDLALKFDNVITEWRFSAINHQKVDVKTKREVLRIGIPDSMMAIKQLSFSPYIKSWNDDFGLLYIALGGESKWEKPLYSGVILRINPAKFGLRSFTIPDNNIYTKNSEINDAIHLLGGQKIAQFIWAGKNSKHILVSHQYDNQHILSLADGQNDWRSVKGKQVLYQSDDAIQSMLIYHGHELSLLRSKLLLLHHKEQNWYVDSLAFNTTDKEANLVVKPLQQEWLVTSPQLPINSQLTLISGYNGEILLLEKTANVLFRLNQQELGNNQADLDDNKNINIEKNSTDYNVSIILLILTLLLSIAYYWFKRNGSSVKGAVRTQFASFELSESTQQIALYHRHESKAETIIDIVDIVSSEVKLNDQVINIINDKEGHGFNHDKEQDFRSIFVKEKVDKMIDGKTRQISLLLTDIRNNSYMICLYMRRGSNRLTKKSYVKVINELIDWCWFIGEKINADNTEKRKVKTIEPKVAPSLNKGNELPLHHQAAVIRPTTHKADHNVNDPLAPKVQPVINDPLSTSKINNNTKPSVELTGEENSKADNKIPQNNTMDTDLVNALEKLVNLQQQGFLTMDEFSKAKEKLLKTLLAK